MEAIKLKKKLHKEMLWSVLLIMPITKYKKNIPLTHTHQVI
jgi:hypothetical protein